MRREGDRLGEMFAMQRTPPPPPPTAPLLRSSAPRARSKASTPSGDGTQVIGPSPSSAPERRMRNASR